MERVQCTHAAISECSVVVLNTPAGSPFVVQAIVDSGLLNKPVSLETYRADNHQNGRRVIAAYRFDADHKGRKQSLFGLRWLRRGYESTQRRLHPTGSVQLRLDKLFCLVYSYDMALVCEYIAK